jgi:ABC-type dipeptide/oligopeptide/nickel transport system ATPase subunit
MLMLALPFLLVKFVFNIISVVGVQIQSSIKMVLEVLVVQENLRILIILHLAGNLGLVRKISKICTVMDMFVRILLISVCLLDLQEEDNL